MMRNQVSDRALNLWPTHVELRQFSNGRAWRGTNIRLLAGVKLCIHHQSVFQVVDTQCCGFAESHRTQVSGDGELASMSGVVRGFHLIACDKIVDLERRSTLVCPEIHGVARVVRP